MVSAEDDNKLWADARALLNNHRKAATCQRASGDSREWMVNANAAVGVVHNLMHDAARSTARAAELDAAIAAVGLPTGASVEDLISHHLANAAVPSKST